MKKLLLAIFILSSFSVLAGTPQQDENLMIKLAFDSGIKRRLMSSMKYLREIEGNEDYYLRGYRTYQDEECLEVDIFECTAQENVFYVKSGGKYEQSYYVRVRESKDLIDGLYQRRIEIIQEIVGSEPH